MGQSLEKAIGKAATESGLLGIESAEINLDSDINLNLDSSSIGVVVAVLVALIVVIVIVITLCSRYCCNCCDNLCFQGRGQNLHKKGNGMSVHDGMLGSVYHPQPFHPAPMSVMPGDHDHINGGCPSCGSQMGAVGFDNTIKRAPSMAASLFTRELMPGNVTMKREFDRRDFKNSNGNFDGMVIPVHQNSNYHTLNHIEKNTLMKVNPQIQYCQMANGEVGMYIPKADLLDVLDHSYANSTMKSLKYYTSDNKCAKSEYCTTETENERRSRTSHDRRRRRRRSKNTKTSMSHRTSSGYKSDSSQSRPKSNRTITMSSLSDQEDNTIHRRRMTIIEETKRSKKSKLSNVEEQLFTSESPVFQPTHSKR